MLHLAVGVVWFQYTRDLLLLTESPACNNIVALDYTPSLAYLIGMDSHSKRRSFVYISRHWAGGVVPAVC